MTSPDDRDWLRSVVESFEGPLTRYARRITRDVERARDVAQDVFVRLCNAPRAEVEPHLREWLYTVCRNRAIDIGRKEGRMVTTDERGFVSLSSDEARPEAALERRETLGRALQLLDRLPARQQEVIRLKFQDGLSYKEISRVTNHSVSYVGVLIHQGIKSLRQSLVPSPEL
ncbi:MAG: sigma-70 family RNA polymerase sigma factor [Planctomycetes bacterium]|nr:sigma-70 family RNA polymerase sigma factor [Planctomycetota bacterium]